MLELAYVKLLLTKIIIFQKCPNVSIEAKLQLYIHFIFEKWLYNGIKNIWRMLSNKMKG